MMDLATDAEVVKLRRELQMKIGQIQDQEKPDVSSDMAAAD
jgi:hypothetical protein